MARISQEVTNNLLAVGEGGRRPRRVTTKAQDEQKVSASPPKAYGITNPEKQKRLVAQRVK
jgi:hypothetical protein